MPTGAHDRERTSHISHVRLYDVRPMVFKRDITRAFWYPSGRCGEIARDDR
jgi:hypothetical protein